MENSGRFQPGHPGLKPKGAISRKCEFENFLFDNFVKNKERAEAILNGMYQNKMDFKWLMGLLAERMPKESSVTSEVTNTEKKIIIEIDKNDRSSPVSAVPEGILQEQ